MLGCSNYISSEKSNLKKPAIVQAFFHKKKRITLINLYIQLKHMSRSSPADTLKRRGL